MSSQVVRRILWLTGGIGCAFCLLIVQYFRIQVVQHDSWSHIAERQHCFHVKEPFLRGTFYSNSDLGQPVIEEARPLVYDIRHFHLFIDPKGIKEPYKDEVAELLQSFAAAHLQEGEEVAKQVWRKSRSRRIAMWLTADERQKILDWWLPYSRDKRLPRNAVYFVADYKRVHPFGQLAAPLLHTVRELRDETTRQALPTGGLELAFNTFLQGEMGVRRLMRSPRNRLATGDLISKPKDGADIYLTINHILQQIAEEELEKGCTASGSKCGWAVMMDPYTGEILALAQYPFFDLDHYSDYFNDPTLQSHTLLHAITDAQEPASTFKPLCLALALQASHEQVKQGKKAFVFPEEKLPCRDGSFPGRRRPISDVTLHYYLNMYMGVQKSSNIYHARIMERFIALYGDEELRSRLQQTYGLGERSGLNLPGESAGVLPEIGKVLPNGGLEWSKATPWSLAMGHNVQLTSLQLIRAWSVLANGGRLVEPTLVRQIWQEDERLVDNTAAERLEAFPRVLDQEVIEEVKRALRYVTKWGGSGRRADIAGYSEAGKSGTARKIIDGAYSRKHHFCSFIGFTPVDYPRFVLLVAMDEPRVAYLPGVGNNHHGGVCCAPVFRRIADRSLHYLGVARDDPHGYPVGDPRRDADLADWVKQTEDLRELYKLWNEGM